MQRYLALPYYLYCLRLVALPAFAVNRLNSLPLDKRVTMSTLVIILVSLAAVLAGGAFLYLFFKGEPAPKEKKATPKPAAPKPAQKVEPSKKTAEPQKVEPAKKAEPPKAPAKPTPSLTDEETISMDKVDHFSEYSAYKQFGYYDQAADSLFKHLSGMKLAPHDLVIELCGMYIECGDIEGMVTALDKFGGNLSKKELEALVKTAFETEPDNLNLCVFAEEKLGWTVEYITRVVQVLSEQKK